mmetsp:Transcript_42901/g.113579  ORF Transcript_42901/g.113579 Transcript_42901/m.113579 type:complete len:592 (-) Transcript_42901:353-2128(-)
MGDHAPIMPSSSAPIRPVPTNAAGLYDLIQRVFLASVAPDAVLETTTVLLEVPFEGRQLRATGHRVRSLGWIEVLPILEVHDDPLPESAVAAAMQGTPLDIETVSVERFVTEPPRRMTESDLLRCMEAHGIGTDASMPQHIAKIIERRYAEEAISDNPRGLQGAAATHVPSNWYTQRREIHSTKLGSVMFRWFMLVDHELALPTVRANVEAAVLQVSRGERDGQEVKDEYLEMYEESFFNMFQSDEAQVSCNTLFRFLTMADAERGRDALWRRAERLIQETRFEEIAEHRLRSLQEPDSRSEPAVPPLRQCLMPDAVVADSNGRLRRVQDLCVGDTLPAVFVQRGQLQRGVCSVSAVRCLLARERDTVTVLTGDGSEVRVTSSHSLMSTRPQQDLSWGPALARDLSPEHVLAFMNADGNGLAQDQELHQVVVSQTSAQRDSTSVTELELNSGEVACWLQAGPAGCVASFGELPTPLNTRHRCVAIWGFSRCPPDFRAALRTSEALDACRRGLESAGFSFQLESGGHMFVRPEEVAIVVRSVRLIRPRSSEVVVSPEFEIRLEEALGLLSRALNVHRRSIQDPIYYYRVIVV